ncbi:MAG: hypothetical protein ACLR8Y_13290 [Alistipes indistinctus]
MTLYGKINNAEQHENLKIALDQFKTYQAKAKELTEKYQAQITGLRAAGYEAEAQEAEKQLNKELKALSASMLKEAICGCRSSPMHRSNRLTRSRN